MGAIVGQMARLTSCDAKDLCGIRMLGDENTKESSSETTVDATEVEVIDASLGMSRLLTCR